MDDYDLEIQKGATFSISLTVNDTGEAPIDLTPYSISGFLKYRYSDTTPLADLNATKIAPYTGGCISLSLSASTTASLPVTVGVYDVEIHHSGGSVTKVLRGKASIEPEVTF
jgi:hypothetical protein